MVTSTAFGQTEVWNNRFPLASPPPGNYADSSVGVRHLAGQVVAAGTRTLGTGISVFQVVKYNEDGSLASPAYQGIWPKDWTGTRKIRTAKVMTATPDGLSSVNPKVFVAGTVPGVGGGLDTVVVAFDAGTLAPSWTLTYSNAEMVGDDIPAGIAIAPDGLHVAVVIESQSPATAKDIVTLVIDVDDHSLACPPFVYTSVGGQDDKAIGVVFDNDISNRLYIAGTTPSPVPGQGSAMISECYTYELLHNVGTLEWSTIVGSPGQGISAAAIACTNKALGVYLTGGIAPIDGSLPLDYLTVKLNSLTGDEVTRTQYDGPNHLTDIALAIVVQDISGGSHGEPPQTFVYVTGASQSVASTDMLTIRYSDGGTILNTDWVGRYHRPDGGNDDRGVALWTHKEVPIEVFITGASLNSSQNADFATTRYDGTLPDPPGSNKEPAWLSPPPGLSPIFVFSGTSTGNDYPSGIAVVSGSGADNKVFVSGRSYSSVTNDDFFTVRIDGP